MKKRKYSQPLVKETEDVERVYLLQDSPPPGGGEDPGNGEGF